MKSILIISLLTILFFSSCNETQEYTNIPIFEIERCKIPISIDHRLLCNPNNEILIEKGVIKQMGINSKEDTIGYKITELRNNHGECTIKTYSTEGQILYHAEYLPSLNYTIDTINKGSNKEIIRKSYKGQLDFIKKWYNNGNLKSEYEYNKGLLNGLEVQYYENGKKKALGKNVQFDKQVASYKYGEWLYFDKKENIVCKKNYIKNNLIGKYTEYYSNGNIKVDGMYNYGNGMCEVSIIDTITYEELLKYVECDNAPVKSGEWKTYEENGTVKSIEKFK